MAFENGLRGFGLPPQCTCEYGIESNPTPGEVASQQACLSETCVGEAVVLIRAERRLPVAYEVERSHVRCASRAASRSASSPDCSIRASRAPRQIQCDDQSAALAIRQLNAAAMRFRDFAGESQT